jgi:hypothetical protein
MELPTIIQRLAQPHALAASVPWISPTILVCIGWSQYRSIAWLLLTQFHVL